MTKNIGKAMFLPSWHESQWCEKNHINEPSQKRGRETIPKKVRRDIKLSSYRVDKQNQSNLEPIWVIVWVCLYFFSLKAGTYLEISDSPWSDLSGWIIKSNQEKKALNSFKYWIYFFLLWPPPISLLLKHLCYFFAELCFIWQGLCYAKVNVI